MLDVAPIVDTHEFPVSLVCPTCAREFDDDGRCGCDDGPRLEWWHGLPRTLFGQNYWGEAPRETMARILDRMETTPWRDALRQEARDEPVTHHLLQHIGADFVYGMPWDRIRTVLEIGSGMGFMTAPLAKFAEKVVAVEAVPERALFLAKRAQQDGLDNIHPIIASGTELPFPAESFDLIAMNGVFEYVGLWGDGDPLEVQRQFLKNVQRLLKPGGLFYIGIETRFSMSAWLGARDHSGLCFTSVMPRWLADWYCRRRRAPFYGSATALDGYRTYTHTPRQYSTMLREAGFPSVEVHGCFDGYNRQVGIAPLDDFTAWKATRSIVDPSCSLLGSLRRCISHNRWTYKTLENEVVVFASKAPRSDRLFWSGLPTGDGIAQLNTGNKVMTLSFDAGQPRSIAKAAKDELDRPGLVHEYETLRRVEESLGSEADQFAVRWPRPLGKKTCNGLDFFDWEFVQGDVLSKAMRSDRARHFAAVVRQLTEGYVQLAARLGTALSAPSEASWSGLMERWGQMPIAQRTTQQRVHDACRRLAARNWRLQAMHGDLTFNNVIRRPDGQLILLDWESVTAQGHPAIDLFRLLYDARLDSQVLSSTRAKTLLAGVRSAVVSALGVLGIESEDLRDVEMLFVAHQHEFDRARDCDVETLLRTYGDPAFTLL